MIEDLYFLDESKVVITAASVGVSNKRWESIKEDEDDGKMHIRKMVKNRFDHLPIIPNNGVITEYYKTKTSDNFDEIERHTISYEDIMPLDTNIETIIEKFYKEKRSFYFLSFNKNISGLITVGNLNCKQVQIYVFSLICELERELALFLNYHLSHEDILNWLKEKSESFEKANQDDECKQNKYYNIIEQYDSLVKKGLENSLTEHLFLVDFFNLICDKEIHVHLSLSKRGWKVYSSINELRHKIAHPTRSLLDKNHTIDKLGKRLAKMKELLFRLNNYKKINEY